MQLWNKQLEVKARKYPLYSQDGKGLNAQILVKYFNPYGAGTWLMGMGVSVFTGNGNGP